MDFEFPVNIHSSHTAHKTPIFTTLLWHLLILHLYALCSDCTHSRTPIAAVIYSCKLQETNTFTKRRQIWHAVKSSKIAFIVLFKSPQTQLNFVKLGKKVF